MTKQVKNLKHLQSEIDSALSLIAHKSTALENMGVPKRGLIAGTESLLERCETMVNRKKDEKPVLRVIHHLACGGGTILSKCIAAMPNTYLLSEAHPYTPLVSAENPVFSPTDIPSLSKYAEIPKVKELSYKIFTDNVAIVEKHTSKLGGTLVLRYHTHSDFCSSIEIPHTERITEMLGEQYNVVKALTIRDPIDAFSSLQKNNWVHFEPQTFDEYCRRFLALISIFNRNEIFRYEDFTSAPHSILEKICDSLLLTFDESFEDTIGTKVLTGDSGRKSDVITKRERVVSDDLLREVKKSDHYKRICDEGWYDFIS